MTTNIHLSDFRFKYIAILVCLVLFSGCATYSKISCIESPGQRLIYQDGRETIISAKMNDVAIALESATIRNGARANFIVAVRNGLNKDIIFSTEDITAKIMTGNSVPGENMKVYSYDDLVREEKKREKWAAIAAALQGMSDSINAANAGYSNTYGTYSGSVYSNYGSSANVYGTYSSTTYNYAAAQAAQNAANARSEARFDQIAAEGRANLEALSSRILKKQTIFPGNWYGGIVEIQMPKVGGSPNSFVVNVNVGNELHSFIFTQKETRDKAE
jgi:hypothetical protein